MAPADNLILLGCPFGAQARFSSVDTVGLNARGAGVGRRAAETSWEEARVASGSLETVVAMGVTARGDDGSFRASATTAGTAPPLHSSHKLTHACFAPARSTD